jgi:CRISPR-associated protein Csx14
VASEADAEAAFRAIYSVVLNAKRAGHTTHLSIVGGRKILAVYGMATAQLLFDDDDRMWYVLAGGEFLESERLHPKAGDEATLIRVPVLRWGTISPMLTDLRAVEDPFEAVARRCSTISSASV